MPCLPQKKKSKCGRRDDILPGYITINTASKKVLHILPQSWRTALTSERDVVDVDAETLEIQIKIQTNPVKTS